MPPATRRSRRVRSSGIAGIQDPLSTIEGAADNSPSTNDSYRNDRPTLVRKFSNSRLPTIPASLQSSTPEGDEKIKQVIMKRRQYSRQSIQSARDVSAAKENVVNATSPEGVLQSPTPYYKVARERGGRTTPPQTRSAKKKKPRIEGDSYGEVRSLKFSPQKFDRSKLNPSFGASGDASMTFSPPDQEINRKREEERKKAEIEKQAKKKKKAIGEGRLLVYNFNDPSPILMEDEDEDDVLTPSGTTDGPSMADSPSTPDDAPPVPVQTPAKSELMPSVSRDTPPEGPSDEHQAISLEGDAEDSSEQGQMTISSEKQSDQRQATTLEEDISFITSRSLGQSSDQIASELKSLRTTITQFVQRPDSARMRLDFEVERKQLEIATESLRNENVSLKHHTEALVTEKQTLTETLETERANAARMALELDSASERFGKLEQANRDLQSRINRLEDENANTGRLASDLESGSRHNIELEQANRDLQSRVESLEAEGANAVQLAAKLDSTSRINGELEQANRDLLSRVTSLEVESSSAARLAAELESASRHNDKLEQANRDLQSRVEQYLKEKEQSANKAVDHLAATTALREKLNEQSSLIVQFEADMASRDQMIHKYESDLHSAETKHREQEGRILELENTVSTCKKLQEGGNEALDHMKTVHQSTLEQLRSTKSTLEEKEEIIAQLNAALEELKISTHNAKSATNLNLKKVETQLAVKSAEFASMQQSLSRANGEVDSLKQQLQESQTLLQGASRDQSTQSEQLLETQSMCRSMKAKVEELETHCEKLQNELESSVSRQNDLTNQLQGAYAQSQGAQNSLSQKLTECQSLQAQINELTSSLKAVTEQRDHVMKRMQGFDMRESELFQKLVDNDRVRQALHNRVMQLSGNIRVFIRVRPALPGEEQSALPAATKRGQLSNSDSLTCFSYPSIFDRSGKSNSAEDDLSMSAIHLKEPYRDRGGLSDRRKSYRFAFDNVFDPDCQQNKIWEATEPLVQSAVDGYNVTLFAYGQTGSGKTYTMLGEGENPGIISRSVEKLFRAKQEIETMSRGKTQVDISVEMLEIYNEKVRDLLSGGSNGSEVEVKVTSNEVVGNVRAATEGKKEVLGILAKAQQRRCVKATASNATSSRGHLLFTIHFNVASENGMSRSGKLHICDLAGSERLNKSRANTQVGGALMTETKHINSSLSVLSNVIEKLQAKDANVPFRESTLTYLLRNSLGGNSKTLAIVCCNPLTSHFHESLSSLRFAAKVNKVDLKAQSSVTI